MPENMSNVITPSASNDEGVSLYPSLSEFVENTRMVELEVRPDHLLEDAYSVVSTVFPQWKRQDTELFQCKDGITNQLVRITHKPSDAVVLVRAYGAGSDRIIDRKQEIKNFFILSNYNMCPPLYARFKNGLVYGYIKGRVASVEDLRGERTSQWIARELARWHKIKPLDEDAHAGNNVQRQDKVWTTMLQWLNEVPETYTKKEKQDFFQEHFDRQKMKQEMEYLRNKIGRMDSPLVFSHNDLLFGNIIFDDEKEKASFIDYEYGYFNARGFDIGNHFNEHAGFDCDYSNYPNKTFQLKWLGWYLSEYSGAPPTQEALETLFCEVNTYSLVSHLYWCLWSLIQAKVSDIDFDYMDYAFQRFSEYKRRKAEVFHHSTL